MEEEEEGGPGGGACRISCSTNDNTIPLLFVLSVCRLSLCFPPFSLFPSLLRGFLRFHAFSTFCPVVPVSV